VKAGIVAGVLALGFHNWRVVRPRLERGEGGPNPMRAAFVEMLLGAAAVAATSFLAAQPLN
jgi:putative copper export protein